jgi:multidrug efflux pump subunit AcrA (membrane-fusion protein)
MHPRRLPEPAPYHEEVRLPPPVAALLAAVVLIAGCSGGGESEIQTAPVTRGDVTEVVEAPATIAAKATTTLNAPASGTVGELSVKDGQRVRRGQVLLRIDSPGAEKQLEQARQADAEAAQAGKVSLPGVDLVGHGQQQRAQRAADGFAAARDAAERIPDPALRSRALTAVTQAEAEYATARQQARAAVEQFNDGLASLADALGSLSQAQRVQTRAAVTAAEQTVAALTVRAPISGTISFGGTAAGSGGAASAQDLAGLVGQLPEGASGQASQFLGGASGGGATNQGALAVSLPVRTGDQLLSVVDVSALSLVAEVDETDVLLVRPGVPADVELDAVPDASYAATVASIDLAPTTSTRGGVAYRVRLSLGGGTTVDGDPAPQPRPGMSAVADLRVRSVKNALAVPSAAIVRDGQRDSVWAVDAGIARRRTVRLGAQGDATVQVVDGLRLGQTIVVRGADRVQEGQEIHG